MNLDFSDLKPSLYSWFMTGIMAVTFIVLAKYLANQYDNAFTRNIREFMNAV